MENNLIVLVHGSSGSGKNVIISEVLKNFTEYKLLVSCTSRAPRTGESNRNPYEFLTREEFENRIKENKMLEYDVTHQNYYGISKKEVEHCLKAGGVYLKDVTLVGILACRSIPEANVLSIFFDVDKKELKSRLINRGDKDIKRRLAIYKKQRKEKVYLDYIIKNHNKEKSYNLVTAILENRLKKEYLNPLKPTQQIKQKNILKHCNRLDKGKLLKPIKVALINGKIYIIDGVHRYLASLKTGKTVAKEFIDYNKPVPAGLDAAEWKKVAKTFDVHAS